MGGRGIGPSCSIPTMVHCLSFKTPLYLNFFNRYPCHFVGRLPPPLPPFSPYCWWGGSTPPLTFYSLFRWGRGSTPLPPLFLPIHQGEVQHHPLLCSCHFAFLPFCEGEPSRLLTISLGRGNTSPSCILAVSLRGSSTPPPLLFLPFREGELTPPSFILAVSSGRGSKPPLRMLLLFC